MLKDIYEIKLSRESFDVSCYSGTRGTTMNFDIKDVAKVCSYYARYGIILKDVGSGGSGGGDGTWEHYVILQFPQFTSILIEKRYIILAVPNSRGNPIMVKLFLNKLTWAKKVKWQDEPLVMTSDKNKEPYLWEDLE